MARLGSSCEPQNLRLVTSYTPQKVDAADSLQHVLVYLVCRLHVNASRRESQEEAAQAECKELKSRFLGTILDTFHLWSRLRTFSSPRLHFELPGPGYMISTSGFGSRKHLPGSVGFLKGPACQLMVILGRFDAIFGP